MTSPPDHGMMNGVHSASSIPLINSSSSRPSAPPTIRRRMHATVAATGAVLMLAVGCSSGDQADDAAVTSDRPVDELTSGSQAAGVEGVQLRDVEFDVRRDPG
jgi:hypothetical protein